ncbi:glycoside hydrolase [Rhypophila decipiens]|uniref:Glycoside hydrolase n=1 Tax=Rhypophila decipiens TaxID=261697 RepID=A0AAN6YHF1_9PEZI|nr:glycoside hydrolase [Rhypophila decipiens]
MAQQAIFRILLLILLTILPNLTTAQQQLSPALPLHASSRWILDANNQRVKFRCVNWAGHQEANIPEGLDKQPVSYIVDWIRRQGFNCVRLTYSTDHALNPSVKVSDSFIQAASAAGVSVADTTKLYTNVVSKNPEFGGNTTTRDVYASVVDTLWSAGIFTILDNHVSKASWCCNLTDGNGWWDEGFGYNTWNSRFFKTQDWLKGLKEMAIWSKSHPGVVGMSLRNEIRAFLLQDLNGRADWYKFIKQGGDIVHANNKDVLIVVGGVQSSTDLVHLRDGNRMLDISGWGRDKHVWEMHAYSFTVNFPDPFQNCDLVKAQYGLYSGFVLEQGKPYTGPMILSEFGVGMTGGSEKGLVPQDSRYLNCLVDYMSGNDADWAVWALQGTYYIRDGRVDADENWGLMDHDWKDWRNKEFPAMLKGMWKVMQGPSKRR